MHFYPLTVNSTWRHWTEISVVDEYKSLGVLFDKKLTFIPCNKFFKKNPPKPNNFLGSWLSNVPSTMQVPNPLTTVQYHFCRKMCQKVLHQRARSYISRQLKTGLMSLQNYSIDSLCAEAYESHVQPRCEKLPQFYTKLTYAHPTLLMTAPSTLNTSNVSKKENKTIKPFGLWMKPIHH